MAIQIGYSQIGKNSFIQSLMILAIQIDKGQAGDDALKHALHVVVIKQYLCLGN